MKIFDRRYHSSAEAETAAIHKELADLPYHVWFTTVHRWAKNAPGEWVKKFGERHLKHVRQYTSDHFRSVVIGWWNRDFLYDDNKEQIKMLKAEHDARVLRGKK